MKITRRDEINYLMGLTEVAQDARAMAFLEAEIARMDAKNSKRSGTMTKEQVANVGIKANLVKLICEGNATVADLRIATGFTSQKVAALVGQLEKEGKVVCATIKNVRHYTVVEDAE